MKQFKIYAFIALSAFTLYSCDQDQNQEQEREVARDVVKEQLTTLLTDHLEEENRLLAQHYNQLTTLEKESLTFDAYKKDMKTRFANYANEAVASFDDFDNRADAQSQADDLRKRLKESNTIPDWYWEFKMNLREEVVNTAR